MVGKVMVVQEKGERRVLDNSGLLFVSAPPLRFQIIILILRKNETKLMMWTCLCLLSIRLFTSFRVLLGTSKCPKSLKLLKEQINILTRSLRNLSLTSKKTKRSTVFGPSRTKAGVQPLNRNCGPSFFNEVVKICNGVAFSDWSYIRYSLQSLKQTSLTACMTRDLITSNGAQIAAKSLVNMKICLNVSTYWQQLAQRECWISSAILYCHEEYSLCQVDDDGSKTT